MDYYSKSMPNLIVPRVEKKLYKMIASGPSNMTISEKISSFFTTLYDSYIKNHLILTILILSLIIYLGFRYYNNKNKNTKEKEQFGGDLNYLSDIAYKQTNNLYYNEQPHFNPINSVLQQDDTVNYPPEPIPLNIPGKGLTNVTNPNEPYNSPYAQSARINTPTYDYNNVYKTDTLSYYNGTYNTYQDAKDTTIQNPLGFSNKFNTTTGNFVGQMTKENNDIINEYQYKMDNDNINLVSNFEKYDDDSEYHIDLPYALD